MSGASKLAERLAADSRTVREEIEEIELLINQARTEAGRHEARRAAAADKLAAATENVTKAAAGGSGPAVRDAAKDLAEAASQLVSVARRSALMEAQIDLLEGKRKTVGRLLETIDEHAARLRELADGQGLGPGAGGVDGETGLPASASHLVLSAQEDLRREIARAMHDGPAQSLTNIVLQAQIVERMLAKDPAAAQREVTELVAMVQRTLEATKTFIFDVRPMVLDDLGLVPTLRRACRDRGRRAGVAVDFESVGLDRRLPAELESGLFRILDDVLAAHIAAKPESLSLHLDWGDQLDIQLTAGRTPAPVVPPDLPPDRPDLPPAIAAMVEERREGHRAAVESARVAALVRIPDRLWRELAGRAELLGIDAELLDEGTRLRLVVPLLPVAEAATGAAAAATGATEATARDRDLSPGRATPASRVPGP
jgi:two-component system sensor histidine kinase DegS